MRRRSRKKALELMPNRVLEEVREKDPDGKIVVHHRTVDTLGKMLKTGTITNEMYDTAKDFQAAFIIANIDTLRALPILRIPGNGRDVDMSDRQLIARRRVLKSIEKLGGIGSLTASALWHVVGLQESVRQWAQRSGWGGQPIRPDVASGILVAGLEILARDERRPS
jgi:hypothetical protein